MIKEFESITAELEGLVRNWERKLSELSTECISGRKNRQNRTIRQITGHLVDSASNNLHRIIHLQYNSTPLVFPNYASEGNNDRWIAIQNFQEEDWANLVQLWKYSNLHLVHVISHIDPAKLENEWIAGANEKVKLKDMVTDYLRHSNLHLKEIEELIHQKPVNENT